MILNNQLSRDSSRRNCLGLLLLFCEIISAEVTFDGSLDSSGSLIGPNYQINANSGIQVRGNLFHSFSVFNINNGETATFTGVGASGVINNIMARVTGGLPSQINGLLSSTISGANLFFFNPIGVIFGPNSSLDVKGAFHVSTADYIRFKGGGKFDTSLVSDNNLLTAEQPESFGFLSHKQPASIHFEESTLVLLPPNVNNFTVTGGDISISENSNLVAVGGSLKLISVSSGGEIKFSGSNIEASDFSKMGTINLGISSSASNSSQPSQIVGNRVIIRGGQLLIENTKIENTNFTDITNKKATIDIQITDSLLIQGEKSQLKVNGAGHNININAGMLVISNGAEIFNRNTSNTQQGSISINAKEIIVDDLHISPSSTKRSIISALGNTDLTLNADNLQVLKGAAIRTQGGSLSILAKVVSLDGVKLGLRSEIFAAAPTKSDSGSLSLSSDQLSILNGARISTSTRARSSGSSGALEIKAKQILVEGIGEGIESSINTETQGSSPNSGNGGRLSIKTDTLTVRNNALITARTRSPGNAGKIDIKAISVEIQNQGKISSESINENSGKAGTISINANGSLLLSGNSEITVDTVQAGAGNIDINADLLHLHQQSSITTSVAGGTGNGGNINISPTLLIINDASKIIANSQEGTAGNIDIQIKDSGTLFRSFDSVIEASSQLGIDGNVEVNAPDVDITSGFKPLPDTFLDVASILQKPCIRRFQGNAIQFVNQKYQVLPDSPYALRTVSYHYQSNDPKLNQSPPPIELTSINKKQLRLTDCL